MNCRLLNLLIVGSMAALAVVPVTVGGRGQASTGPRDSVRHGISNTGRHLGREILKTVYESVERNYYDPQFRGVDLAARYTQMTSMADRASSVTEIMTVAAGMLAPLDDSHLLVLPPSFPQAVNYGFNIAMIGDKCYVVATQPGSDAATRLHVGDKVNYLEGTAPSRSDLWKLKYNLEILAPRLGVRIHVAKAADAEEQALHANAAAKPISHDDPNEFAVRAELAPVSKTGSALAIEQQLVALGTLSPAVGDVEPNQSGRLIPLSGSRAVLWTAATFPERAEEIDTAWDNVKGYDAVILDLRGNRGGSSAVLKRMAGNIFDGNITIAQRVGRSKAPPIVAASRQKPYGGKILVLVDSETAGGAELFARLLQIQKRGTVIGGRTAGSVMEARRYNFTAGDGSVKFGAMITEFDLRMSDGKSLEHIGVTPDEVILPTQEDLAKGRDPQLARAAALAGAEMDSAAAGKLASPAGPQY